MLKVFFIMFWFLPHVQTTPSLRSYADISAGWCCLPSTLACAHIFQLGSCLKGAAKCSSGKNHGLGTSFLEKAFNPGTVPKRPSALRVGWWKRLLGWRTNQIREAETFVENGIDISGGGDTLAMKGFSSENHISSPNLQDKGRHDINYGGTNNMSQNLRWTCWLLTLFHCSGAPS